MRISIVCGEYHRIIKGYLPILNNSRKFDIEEILPTILKSTRPYFLCSTIILIIVYLIMFIFSPMSCIKTLGLTLIFYIIINYLTHCTFFSSCLVITLKRIQSNRHCLFCTRLSNDYNIEDQRKTTKKTRLEKIKEFTKKIDPVFKKFSQGFLCLLSFLFLISSIWLILSIDTGLFNENFLPKSSTSLRSYMKSQVDDYDIGPVVMFVIPKPVNYKNIQTQLSMRKILQQCQNEPTINNFTLFWLDQDNITTLLTSKEPYRLRMAPYSFNDIILAEGKNKTFIKATRFYCQYNSIKGK